jgi:hypothetical protein
VRAYHDEGAEGDELGVLARKGEEPHAHEHKGPERVEDHQVVAPHRARDRRPAPPHGGPRAVQHAKHAMALDADVPHPLRARLHIPLLGRGGVPPPPLPPLLPLLLPPGAHQEGREEQGQGSRPQRRGHCRRVAALAVLCSRTAAAAAVPAFLLLPFLRRFFLLLPLGLRRRWGLCVAKGG